MRTARATPRAGAQRVKKRDTRQKGQGRLELRARLASPDGGERVHHPARPLQPRVVDARRRARVRGRPGGGGGEARLGADVVHEGLDEAWADSADRVRKVKWCTVTFLLSVLSRVFPRALGRVQKGGAGAARGGGA